ncbi:MAG: hypothetical protein KC964_08600 [Candidatus Omnitrophica bacterium]|nr:hypothetical protein [Candidatus Omnitrophota bacterium]
MTVSEAHSEPTQSPVDRRKNEGALTPCPLFRRVQKRDATIVDFCPDKITEAIYRAAVAVGGKDRRRSEVLCQYVILDLAERYQESTNLLHIEQIQDSIEQVLMEHGHYRTSRAFITYRNERARRRAMKGDPAPPSALRGGNQSLHETSVWTSSGERVRWDREQIVKALVRETNLSYDDARSVSYAVEMEIIHSKISHLTAPLIRELTNVHLLQMGFEAERRLHSRLGLPVYDVEQQLVQHTDGREGESIESEILRQFAMEKVLPVSVSEAHGRADLHVHDLEKIHHVIERVRDLDLEPRKNAEFPHFSFLEETEWDRFLHSWETEENRLLGEVGKTLVWNHVNAAIAFHAQRAGIEISAAVTQVFKKICRRRLHQHGAPSVVWRMHLDLDPRWRGRFIGARQLSLLPEDEIDAEVRCALLEVLRQAQEMGPFLSGYGIQLELILPSRGGENLEAELVRSAAECLQSGTPLRIFFNRDTPIGQSGREHSSDFVQAISLNFPRAALMANGSDDRLVEWIEDRLSLIAEAHLEKRNLLERLGRIDSRTPGLDFGIGVWGLVEMTLLHLEKNPREDEEALKWLLKTLARVRLRLEEISARKGLNLSLFFLEEEILEERFSQSLPSKGFDPNSPEKCGLLHVDEDSVSELVIEGKLHSLFNAKQAVFARPFKTGRSTEDWEKWLQTIASKTHLGGIGLIGKWTHCAGCGSRFQNSEVVCLSCGGQDLYSIERRNQGKQNRIARL